MRKYISFLTVALCISGTQAQDISDALRYAQDNTIGTARFRAMSGAFGALGGDMSAIGVNPAGSAIFANNHLAITANNYNTKNKSSYFGTNISEDNNSFDLNQAGGVFIFENYKEGTDWKKFSIAINYENLNNFDNSSFSVGTNPLNSGSQFFLSYANGNITTDELDNLYYDQLDYGGQQASLAYWSHLIDPAAAGGNNNLYVNNIAATGNFYQENEMVSTGYNGKLTFNAAAQYKDLLFLGFNLNSHFTDYRRQTSFYEDYAGATNADATQGIQSFRFNNDLYTYGAGFSFQLGAIAKLTPEIRLGIAYESPTWMKLNDELKQSLTTICADCPNTIYHEEPDFPNVYEPYKISTPSKFTGSAAYIFGKVGLISVDFSTKDYSTTEFKPQNDFRNLNSQMESLLTRANEWRIGAEYKISQWSLRGGYRFEESPYKNKSLMGDLTGYSGGLGYNFGSTKLDFAYSTAKRDYADQFFSQGMTDKTKINSKNDNITVTLAFEL